MVVWSALIPVHCLAVVPTFLVLGTDLLLSSAVQCAKVHFQHQESSAATKFHSYSFGGSSPVSSLQVW